MSGRASSSDRASRRFAAPILFRAKRIDRTPAVRAVAAQQAEPRSIHSAQCDACAVKAGGESSEARRPERRRIDVASGGENRRYEDEPCPQPTGERGLSWVMDAYRNGKFARANAAPSRTMRPVGAQEIVAPDEQNVPPRPRDAKQALEQAVTLGLWRGVMAKDDPRPWRQRACRDHRTSRHAFVGEQPDARPIGIGARNESRRVAACHVDPYSSAI